MVYNFSKVWFFVIVQSEFDILRFFFHKVGSLPNFLQAMAIELAFENFYYPPDAHVGLLSKCQAQSAFTYLIDQISNIIHLVYLISDI